MANTRGPLNSGEATTAVLVGGVYNESAPAPADQQAMALQVDDQGNLLVNVAAGGGGAIRTPNVGTASVQSTSGSPSTLIAAVAANYTDITSLVMTNEGASATIVSLSDGTVTYKYALAANGGIVMNFTTPLPASSINTGLDGIEQRIPKRRLRGYLFEEHLRGSWQL